LLICEEIERVAVICEVVMCVVFVIECEGDKFLFVWGLGKVTITTESERIGNWGRGIKSQMPRARGELPEARGMEDQGWGQWQGDQGAGKRGQRPGTRVRSLKEQAGCVSCLNNW
jgi:hypothetical protein